MFGKAVREGGRENELGGMRKKKESRTNKGGFVSVRFVFSTSMFYVFLDRAKSEIVVRTFLVINRCHRKFSHSFIHPVQ